MTLLQKLYDVTPSRLNLLAQAVPAGLALQYASDENYLAAGITAAGVLTNVVAETIIKNPRYKKAGRAIGWSLTGIGALSYTTDVAAQEYNCTAITTSAGRGSPISDSFNIIDISDKGFERSAHGLERFIEGMHGLTDDQMQLYVFDGSSNLFSREYFDQVHQDPGISEQTLNHVRTAWVGNSVFFPANTHGVPMDQNGICSVDVIAGKLAEYADQNVQVNWSGNYVSPTIIPNATAPALPMPQATPVPTTPDSVSPLSPGLDGLKYVLGASAVFSLGIGGYWAYKQRSS